MQRLSFLAILFFGHVVFAQQNLKGGLLFGTDQAQINIDQSVTQSSTNVSFFLDYDLDDRNRIGIDHIRPLQLSNSSSVTMTGVNYKYFFLTPSPRSSIDNLNSKKTFIQQKSISPYTGLSLGFLQSNLVSRVSTKQSSIGVFLYGQMKFGIEYQVWNRTGLRFEMGYANSLGGSGSSTVFNLLFGPYYNF